MTAGVAQFVMTLALRCLPHDRRDWAEAMQAEFDVAQRDGRPLGFAIGCLWTACRDLPFHNKGRYTLASHAFVLTLLVPIATFHLGCAVSAGRFMMTGRDPYYAMLIAKGDSGRLLADAYRAATPAIMILLLLLGTVHLLLAWSILDGRWRRVSILWLAGALIAAVIIAIIATVAPTVSGIAIQLAALAIELLALPPLAAWQRTHSHIVCDMEV